VDPSAVPLRFLTVGALNTLAGLLIIYLGKAILGLGDIPSNALGYGCGLALSFALNRSWTFGHTGAPWPALIRFLAVVAVAYVGNLIAVMLAITAGINSYAAQALGVPIYTAISFWGARRYAFAAS
jgi:putative flippase GtrA